nr:3-oxoadipate enol-lactonase [Rhizobium sp. Q54]
MQFVRINDVTIRYSVTSENPANPVLVLVNSLGTDGRIWHHVLPKLSDDFTILTYDKRGHGLSDLGDAPYSIDDHVDDLIGLLDHLEFSRVVICGLSVGGMIAQRLYERRPELLRGMILSNTAHKIGAREMWNQRIAAVEVGGIGSLCDEIMSRWFTSEFRQPANPAYQGYCNMLTRQPLSGYTGTCAAVRDADFTASVPKIAVPVLCIAGEYDGSTPPELVRSLADLIPGSQYKIIEGAAHIPCVEAPAAYAAVIRSFLFNDIMD